MAAVLQYRAAREAAAGIAVAFNPDLKDWASAGRVASRYRYAFGDDADYRVAAEGGDTYTILKGSERHTLNIVEEEAHTVRVLIDTVQKSARYWAADLVRLHLAIDGASFVFENLLATPKQAVDAASGGHVRAPMHGKLLRLSVAAGDDVRPGQALAVIEAMKMEHEIEAAIAGRVAAFTSRSATRCPPIR